MSKKRTIASMRAAAADLSRSMRMFCLSPTQELFDKITQNKAVMAKTEPLAFGWWASAAQYKYNLVYSAAKTTDFETAEPAFVALCMTAPTRGRSLAIMYMFYATGELKYSDLFFQLIGHDGMPTSTKQGLAAIWRETVAVYSSAVVSMSDAALDNCSVKRDVVSFAWLAAAKAAAAAEIKRREEIMKMTSSQASESSMVKKIDNLMARGEIATMSSDDLLSL